MKNGKQLSFGVLFCLLFIAVIACASGSGVSTASQPREAKTFMQDGLARNATVNPGGDGPPAVAAYIA